MNFPRNILIVSAFMTAAAPAQELVAARTVEVIARPIQGATSIPGELRPYRAIDVYARVSGFVSSVPVDRGSRVRRGDILAKIKAPEMEAKIAEAKARAVAVESERAAAEARTAALESTLNRLREAAKTPGAIAGNELVLAAKALEAEKARAASIDKSVASAQASVTALEEMLRYLDVYAEFDGVITERMVHEGALVGPESKGTVPLFRLEQIDRLRLVASVPEALAGSIQTGRRISFTVAAHPGTSFTATVARPAMSIDPKTRTMPVELDVVNTGSRLAPGMYADVAWPQSRGGNALLVPAKAIKATTERIFVIRINNGTAEWVDVRRGAAGEGDLVEVSGNLKAGDRILERASDEILPGTRIAAK